MEILSTVREMQVRAEGLRQSGKRVAVVPTMGALHEGHISLLTLARKHSDVVILTIFVNPTQFGPQEDFQRYPRDFESDQRLATEAGVDLVFAPDVAEMYPDGFLTFVATDKVSGLLEGKVRPTHFQGVTTVVAKLFNTTRPHVAVFGQKDAQQLFIIRAMVKDLNFDIEVLAAPIVREGDGLAKSSRNIYLSKTERPAASSLYRSLLEAKEMIGRGERDLGRVRDAMVKILSAASPSGIDYVAFVDPETFREVEDLEGDSILILLAVRFGSTRLIDNMQVPLR